MLQTAIAPQLEAADQQRLTDAQVLALMLRGGNRALSEIHDRYIRLVFSLALKTLNDDASAEEIVQQVFTEVRRHAWHYRPERWKLSTWLSTMTCHQWIDELRRRGARLMTDPGYWEALDRLVGNDDLAQSAQDRFEQARMRAALHQIPTQERIVIDSAFWGGMTQ